MTVTQTSVLALEMEKSGQIQNTLRENHQDL